SGSGCGQARAAGKRDAGERHLRRPGNGGAVGESECRLTAIRELLPPETGLAFAAMRELRPQFADEASFVRRIDDVQRAEEARLVGAFEEGTPEAVAVAGFR